MGALEWLVLLCTPKPSGAAFGACAWAVAVCCSCFCVAWLSPPAFLTEPPARASCCRRAEAPWPTHPPLFPPCIVEVHLSALRSQVSVLQQQCSGLLTSLPPRVLSTFCFQCQCGPTCSCRGRPLKREMHRRSLRSCSSTMIPPWTVVICFCGARLIGWLFWFVCSISGSASCCKQGQCCRMCAVWLFRVFVRRPLIASLYIQARVTVLLA